MSNARQTNATVGRGARASLIALATIVLMTSAFGWVRAQGFTGSYAGDVAIGPIVVELWQDGARVQGTLRGSGVAFDLDGEVAAGALSGWAVTAEGTVGFEAYLHGETLGLYLFDVDARGEPVVESVVELLLTRRGG
nr:hypothetical protein [Trueperaceae bacterium]